jgi:hypothetical protein
MDHMLPDNEELLTPEQTLQQVLGYLKEAARRPDQDPAAFTPQRIQAAVNVPLTHVEEALSALKEKKRVLSAVSAETLYFPANSEGRRALSRVASHRQLGINIGLLACAITIIAFVLIQKLDLFTGYNGSNPDIVQAQKTAFGDGLIFGIFCIFLAAILAPPLGKVLRWRLQSETRFRQVQRLMKMSFWAAAISVLGYAGVERALHRSFDPSIAVGIVAIVVAVASGYFFFAHRPILEDSAAES